MDVGMLGRMSHTPPTPPRRFKLPDDIANPLSSNTAAKTLQQLPLKSSQSESEAEAEARKATDACEGCRCWAERFKTLQMEHTVG